MSQPKHDILRQIAGLKSELDQIERRHQNQPIATTKARMAALNARLADLERELRRA